MEFKSKVTSPKTIGTDSDNTLVTKNYVDGEILGVELTPGPPGAIGPTGPEGIQGETGYAKGINLIANALIIRDSDDTLTPATVTVTGTTQLTNIADWAFSADGDAFTSTPPAGVSVSGDVVMIASASMLADMITVKAISGGNIIKDSGLLIETDQYLIKRFDTTEDIQSYTQYTVSLKGTLPASQRFNAYLNRGWDSGVYLDPIGDDIYVGTFATPLIKEADKRVFDLYQYPSGTTGDVIIEWIKLEKGITRTPWEKVDEIISDTLTIAKIADGAKGDTGTKGADGVKGDTGLTGPTGPTGPATFFGNLDGGTPYSTYGGMDAINAGGVSNGD